MGFPVPVPCPGKIQGWVRKGICCKTLSIKCVNQCKLIREVTIDMISRKVNKNIKLT